MPHRTVRVLLAAALATVASMALPAPAHSQELTRYSLAGGCFTLTGPDGAPISGAERVRMQASALGSYLLYRPDGSFLAATSGGAPEPAAQPSAAADWRVEESGGAFTLTPGGEGRPLEGVHFTAADGCARFPEAQLNATGAPRRSPVSYGRVAGLVEGHMHWMTFEYFGRRFHCGRPWHPFGITRALPDCAEIEGPQGTAAPLQNTLNYGNPGQPHDTRGYPQMTEWRSSNLTYEGTYWRWIQRSWLAGLRLMVMGVNENRVLCELQENRETNCNEMDTVRRGFKAVRDLQDYVDAQAGGPGKGFFQVVTNPFQARRVINQGKMAVVLEIEISEPFDCRGTEQPSCDREQVDRQLDEMYRLGVRSSLLLNKFDNPLTGVRFDSGPIGAVINAGNRQSAGTFWDARTCEGPLHDNEIESGSAEGSAFLDPIFAALGVQGGTFPSYPPAPHCNTRGLTPLGRHVVRRMMELKMIVNPDHMSQAGVDETLSLLEARRYSGVISPHGWMDPGNWPRLWKLGGLAFPGHSSAPSYVDEWRQYRPRQTPFEFGWGYGADLGGLSQQPRPHDEGDIAYPFKSYDGRVTFSRQRTGERTFDYNQEGVAHYGLYPEWFEDLRRLGGRRMQRDMSDGAEAYIQMWERAQGIRPQRCTRQRTRFSPRGHRRSRLGMGWRRLLQRAGQPQQRTRAWSWCVRGKRNRRAADVAVLNPRGRVELVGSTAYNRRAGGVTVGRRMRGRGIRVRRTRRGAWVYAVRGGRVRAVAVTTRRLARRPRALRVAMRRVRRAKVTQAKRRYIPGAEAAASGGRLAGRTLAGTRNTRLNRQLELLCRLQVQG